MKEVKILHQETFWCHGLGGFISSGTRAFASAARRCLRTIPVYNLVLKTRAAPRIARRGLNWLRTFKCPAAHK